MYKLNCSYLLVLAIALMSCNPAKDTVNLVVGKNPDMEIQSSAETLRKHLYKIYKDYVFTIVEKKSDATNINILLTTVSGLTDHETIQLKTDFPGIELPEERESYVIKAVDHSAAVIAGYDERGLIYGVYDLLEHLGYRFYLSQDFVPEKKKKIQIEKWNYNNKPLTGKRIIFNWHNFISGITGWNLQEYKQWIDAARKMKYNAIMVHAYGNNPMYRFNFNGIKKPSGYFNSSARGRGWGNNHVNDIRNLYGGEIFSEAVFGSDVSKAPEDKVEEEAVGLMQDVFRYAEEKNIDSIFGFDIATSSSNPQSLLKTLPEDARLYNYQGQILANPETPEGYRYFKSQITGLLNNYPELDYLVPWVRYMFYPEDPNYFTLKEMPEKWQQEYTTLVEKYPDVPKDYTTNSFFYIKKVMQAYEKILQEVGHSEIKLGLGTWNWVSFPYFDKFISEEVAFFPIDWSTNFESDYARETLSQLKKERVIYPIVWAHHDDHSHIGRPYIPPSSMAKKLKERKAEGFGILHWTTWPLDMYFKNLSQQVWKATANENYQETIMDYATNAIRSESWGFNKYLKDFYQEGPQFGRATTDYFYQMYLTDKGKRLFPVNKPDSILEAANHRLLLLNTLKDKSYPVVQSEIYKYYQTMEEFFILFFKNQKLLIEAAGLYMDGDISAARSAIKKTSPENVVFKYAEAIKHGPETIGEKAIIVYLNLEWLPDFIDIKQKAGLVPIQYKFCPTSHEPLAQGVGHYTYYFAHDKSFRVCLGKKETGGNILSNDQGGYLNLTDSTVQFAVGHWRKVPQNYFSNTWKDNKLQAGNYTLKVNVGSAAKSQNNQKIIVELLNDSNEPLNGKKKVFPVRDSFILVPFKIGHSLLHISLKSKDKPISLFSISIE